jgi:hypothetical protein
VQHGAVGLVADGAQQVALSRWGWARSAGQRLVGVGGQHHLVEMLGAMPGDDAHALASRSMRRTGCSGACRQCPRRSCRHSGARRRRTVHHCGRLVTWISPWLWQKRIMVATGNCSIWSVGQLQMQPSMGRKYQSRNSPKRCCSQEVAQRLHAARRPVRPGPMAGGQRVEAQQVAQHAQEARVHQVAALGKHGVEVGAAPLQRGRRPAPGTCTENDMSDLCRGHAQLG